MKTLRDYTAEEQGKTIFEITKNEKLDIEGFEFFGEPYCHFIAKQGDYRYFVKYEAPQGSKNAFFNNGYYRIDVECDDMGEYIFPEAVKCNIVVEL